jgi:hypothetical protein
MLRTSVFAAFAIALFGSSLLSTADARVWRNVVQNRVKCHEKIDPKGLKGAALKSEFSKCMENPDNYI